VLIAASFMGAVASVSSAQDDAPPRNVKSNIGIVTAPLKSGEYFIEQSWSQERDYQRPYYVSVPEHSGKKKLPVLIFLHGNGGKSTEAMRGFGRQSRTIASQYILVYPQGYRESWNIVSERSRADDRGFIESMVQKLATFKNVDPNNFNILGVSNGAALVNQLMIESSLPNVRNYISGVSPLNVWQYDGTNFKAKGDDNDYQVMVTPAKGKRLMNISGVDDELVPYDGGPSRAIPAKNGKLAFVAAEESTFVWARHMGYEGKQLSKPTKVDGPVEIFSYLGGEIVHCKVNHQGHGAVHSISEKLLLDFLGKR
jgi:polyhydroxybutyrate depolymerase